MLLPRLIQDICSRLAAERNHVLLGGITSRELLARRNPEVYEVFTDAGLVGLAQLHEMMEFSCGRSCDARLRLDDVTIHFHIFKSPMGGISFDLLRRIASRELITVNTFFYDCCRSIFLDPLDAYPHLKGKELLPAPSFIEAFSDYPAKVFDMLHLYGHHEFSLSQEFLNLWGRASFRAEGLESGDLKAGLTLILTGRNPFKALEFLDRHNMLSPLLPELAATKKVPQDKDHHPEGNIYEHTLECFKHISRPSLHLALALLLHDIGKPSTAVFQKNLRFPGHGKAGSRIAAKLLTRLGFDGKLVSDVSFLIEHHLVAHEFRIRNDSQKAELMRNPLFPELLKLYKADILSCFGELGEFHRIVALYKKNTARTPHHISAL